MLQRCSKIIQKGLAQGSSLFKATLSDESGAETSAGESEAPLEEILGEEMTFIYIASLNADVTHEDYSPSSFRIKNDGCTVREWSISASRGEKVNAMIEDLLNVLFEHFTDNHKAVYKTVEAFNQKKNDISNLWEDIGIIFGILEYRGDFSLEVAYKLQTRIDKACALFHKVCIFCSLTVVFIAISSYSFFTSFVTLGLSRKRIQLQTRI